MWKKFLCLGLLSSAIMAQGRVILTENANRDYENRIIAQSQLKDRLSIPQNLDEDVKAALKFLYAYIATPDLLDYDNGFYIDNVRLALRAAEEMPWGKMVPDREWRHFVLPVRVNNEDLDQSRNVFFEELKERVKDLSMTEAMLEVNHWCHEKVSYQPSDARTSSPLATVRNALGRCGEESTFAVAALRSVGIPARQVYTPRWAHTDDNHAWVEAWADGKWHFLGACEPEAVPDLAWFNEPASRGMLMNTNVVGAYDGPEEQIGRNRLTTVINVTENYAPVSKSLIYVTDSSGNPVKDATVRFLLYNYAELYPLAVKQTDESGKADFISGAGDMMIHVSDGNRYALAQIHGGDSLNVVPDRNLDFTGGMDFNLTPPQPGGKLPFVSEEARRLNDQRKAYEDSIRLAYTSTFFTPEKAEQFCRNLALPAEAAPLLVKSRGNHEVIEAFLRNTSPEKHELAVELLKVIAEKDLHDVTLETLEDNINYLSGDPASPLFKEYILNPRIENELLRPFRKAILEYYSDDLKNRYIEEPTTLAADLKRGIVSYPSFNPHGYRQSPLATIHTKVGDRLNREIAFVSVCRALGIPACIDPVSHSTRYADNTGGWHDVDLSDGEEASELSSADKGTLAISYRDLPGGKEPKYYSQFTVSRLTPRSSELLEFDEFEGVSSINGRKEQLEAGPYMLVSGQRLADGSVLGHAEFFNIPASGEGMVALEVRQDPERVGVIGSFDSESLYLPLDSNLNKESSLRSVLSTTGRGYYVLGIIRSGHEPSSHALNDLSAAAEELERLGRPILLLFENDETASRFRKEEYGELPANVSFGIDNGSILSNVAEGLELNGEQAKDLPLFIIADTFNRVVFANRGYAIHLGDKIAGILRAVE